MPSNVCKKILIPLPARICITKIAIEDVPIKMNSLLGVKDARADNETIKIIDINANKSDSIPLSEEVRESVW